MRLWSRHMYLFALIYTFLGSEVCIKFSLYLSTTIKNHFLIVFRERRLQEHGVELLWVKLQDLLTSTADEPRREALIFFEAVIRGQYLQLVSFICTKMTFVSMLLNCFGAEKHGCFCTPWRCRQGKYTYPGTLGSLGDCQYRLAWKIFFESTVTRQLNWSHKLCRFVMSITSSITKRFKFVSGHYEGTVLQVDQGHGVQRDRKRSEPY